MKVLPLACAVVGCMAFAWGRGAPHIAEKSLAAHNGRADGDLDAPGVANDGAAQWDELKGRKESLLADAERMLGALEDAPGKVSSQDRFLVDLEKMVDQEGGSRRKDAGGRVGEGGEWCFTVYWSERGDVPTAAEGVLKEYAKSGEASMATTGYLDLSGNVWGALLEDGASWCDVLTVSTNDGCESVVRITRIVGGSA